MLATDKPSDGFAIENALLDVNGNEVNKRDRLSYAILHQVSGEYRGEFGDLTAVLGVRAPFFTRELNQYCFTTTPNAGQGFIDCLGTQDTTAYETATPNYAPPQSRTYNYADILPNNGLVYVFGQASVE